MEHCAPTKRNELDLPVAMGIDPENTTLSEKRQENGIYSMVFNLGKVKIYAHKRAMHVFENMGEKTTLLK